MRHLFQFLVACSAFSAATLASFHYCKADEHADSIRSSGKIVAVTLYRTQAMVTREVDMTDELLGNKLIIDNLPDQIVVSSLFAEGDSSIGVRTTQMHTRAVDVSPRDAIRNKEAQIAEIQASMRSMELQQQSLAKRVEYLDKLEGFVAPTATTEMTHGVLNAESLKALTTFSFEQRESILKEQSRLRSEAEKSAKELELAQRQLAELTNGATKTAFETVIFLDRQNNAKGRVRLSYLVNQCGWSPNYTLRANAKGEEAIMEYNAVIRQFSGEDWSDAQVTLSTADPAMSASRPSLAPYRIGLNNAVDPNVPVAKQDYAGVFNGYRSQQRVAQTALSNSVDFVGNFNNSLSLNRATEMLCNLELTADARTLKNLMNQAIESDQQPSLSYELEGRVSLANRRDEQILRIVAAPLPANTYLVATPLLTNYVYREAELTNKSKQDFLGGQVTVYLADQFVGRTEIPMVSRGQKFVIGLGADPQLRAKREVLTKEEKTQGGNRRITIQYRLTLDNYHEQVAKVRLMDRMPKPSEGLDIRVVLNSDTPALSIDPIYQSVERPEGILRWDLDVPNKGGDSSTIDYGFSVEFDKAFQLTNASDTPTSAKEFEQLLLKRSRY